MQSLSREVDGDVDQPSILDIIITGEVSGVPPRGIAVRAYHYLLGPFSVGPIQPSGTSETM